VVNRQGLGILQLYDAATLRALRRPPLPAGTVSSVAWNESSREVAFNLNSPQSPNDVWSIDVASVSATRWTETTAPGLDARTFATPVAIDWKSFDGRTIRGFLTRPPRASADAVRC
jgi:dipeptidyl aminopeptidase/acylaminoacyl peptidase